MAYRSGAVALLASLAVVLSGREAAGFRLRRAGNSTTALSAGSSAQGLTLAKPPACTCQTSHPSWKKANRTTPECVFIDLGAADGNTFRQFEKDGYGPVRNCPGKGAYEAYLVEANPHFDGPLRSEGTSHPRQVHPMPSTAAYMCEGQTSFYLDTVNHDQNYWGSSMSANHPDAQKSGHQEVTVPTTNLIRMLYEKTIPGDWVMVKMDIEGAEYEILPCLAQAPETAKLVDRLYLERHPASWASSKVAAPDAAMNAALAKLRSFKVDIPKYFSHTM
jgi:FkbM family methyltransferase